MPGCSRRGFFERYDQPGVKTDDRGVFDAGRFGAVWAKDPDGCRAPATAQVAGCDLARC